ncbi:MAG: putative processing chain [Thermoleophilia bacterium]|nr:putative processing chain [Thermoleophilia bacterium]
MTAALPGWMSIEDPRLPDRCRHVQPGSRGFWFAGDPDALGAGVRIGIVGSRHPRTESLAHARRIAREAARVGCTVVSGLAIGIDGAAHEAALAAGGRTVGIVAGGLASIHPRRNRDLARRMAGSRTAEGVAAGVHADARGAVVSEYGRDDEAAHAYRFQERNRLIAAMSDYLVVVQATHGSGSMGTARHALELGVPIGIVPSAPDDSCYSGGIALIQDGADAVVDGHSLFVRLELHQVMAPGFAAAARNGARLDPSRAGCWTGGDPADQLELALPDHPLASFVRTPRGVEEVAELAGLDLRSTRRLLLELEEAGGVTHQDDGTWVASDVAAQPTLADGRVASHPGEGA